MRLNFTDFLYMLILLGSLQGMITGSLLYDARPRRVTNRLLAVLVWLIALPGIHLFGHHVQFFDDSVVTDWIHALAPWMWMMAVGPLIYLYIRSLAVTDFALDKKDRLHFVPVVIDLLPKIAEILFLVGWLPVALLPDKASLTRFINDYNQYADLPRWASLAYYVYLSARFIRQGQIASAANDSTTVAAWAGRFIGVMKVFVVIWGCYLIPYLIPATSATLMSTIGWFPIYIPLAVLIYWIGIAGYRNSLTASARVNSTPAEAAYSVELLQQTAQTLIDCLEKSELYLDPALDVATLAQAAGIAPKLVSATLNQHLNSSFSQFVNEYRVTAFKQRVFLPGSSALTIAGLAASCGFSSPATFQRIFKQMTGVTPTEFRKNAQPVA